MSSDQPFLIAIGVVSSLIIAKVFVQKVTHVVNWLMGKKIAAKSPNKSQQTNSIVNLEKKPKSIERPNILTVDHLPEENTDSVVLSSEQTIKPFENVRPRKQKSANLTPKERTSRKNDLLKRAKRMSTDSFLRIPYDPIFQNGKPISETPRKSESNSTLFDQKSPRLMSSKPFSPYNYNRPLSVAEIIEGWPFKSPLKRSANANQRNHPAGKGNRSTMKKPSTQLNVPNMHEANKENEWNTENVDNILGSADSGGRYPKSMYISPFGITGRRPISQSNS